ncbi:MAG TPA: CDP-alcohol phosphatidyltransferase family protein [Candidatus Pacearchaeota archaeon]|nr:CDP-alcohol phosphatidyltransferase family protein [Candidatus Pacearchaeota archaeon]HOK94233.1 CDP-alcohol phosphatidyltransferase family protein [Candidatus Pacearchaeota archaeon]HPO75347.1 CDP-alcohol phosphatidyltransferase family protein [Candidatus Pacearchaeota archaeon]
MLKEFFNTDKISLPIGKIFSHFPFSPNQWSIISVFIGILGLYFAIQGEIILAFIVFLLAGLCDTIDGGLARYTDKETKFGAFLDGSMDRFVDFLLIFSFAFLNLPDFLMPIDNWLIALAFFSLMSSFEIAYADHRGAVPGAKGLWGIFRRTERYPLLLVALLFVNFSRSIATYLVVFVTIMSFLNAIQLIILTYIKSKNTK